MALAQVYQFPPIEASPKVATVKRPSFQFYPADWRKDPALAACSLAARGLWMELLCIAHESERYGFLSINGKAMTPAQLARIVGETPALVTKLLREIEDAGVLSRTGEGVIFSRRMVRDEELRNIRAANGVKGAEHGKKGAPHGVKGGRPVKATAGEITPLETPQEDRKEPPPSSSASSSTSISSVAKATAAEPQAGNDPPEPEKQKTPEELAKQELWRSAVALLASQGIDNQQARTLIGKLGKDYGTDVVLEAVRSAVVTQPADARSWLVTACKGGAKRGPKAENFDAKDYGSGVEAL